MSLYKIRLLAVILATLGTGACAGSNPTELIPVGLRTSLAAEDKANQKGPETKGVSVDEMLAKARGGVPPSAAPAAEQSAGASPSRTLPPDGARDEVSPSAEPAAPTQPVSAAARADESPATASGGVHPLWAQFNARAQILPATTPTVSPAAVAESQEATPAPLPLAANSVVVRFGSSSSDLSADERDRLAAAVTLHKAISTGARIVAGPAGQGAAFERLLVAEKRSQVVDQALPEALPRTRDYSPRIEADTVRIEFKTSDR